jgi:beta-lactamase class A
MIVSLFRRSLLIAIISIPLANSNDMPSKSNDVQQHKLDTVQKKLAKLEASLGGRLGISAIDTTTKKRIQYRAKERFPMCSTSKVMAVSAILNKSVKDVSLLQKNITYTQQDLDHGQFAPITTKNLSTGMSIGNLCAATIDYSDNTAMNLLLKEIGGPQAVTTYARYIGDNTYRLDRFEPELNTAIPGDLRDTTTPLAMEKSLRNLTLENALPIPQRKQLQTWLKSNTTGDTKIRAGVPKNWIVGDKTGSGSYGTTNDIGIIWPPKCSPIVVAVYYTQNKKDAVANKDIIASAIRIIIEEFSQTNKCLTN